jgi:hypothetical protein
MDGVDLVASEASLESIRMIILFGITTFLLYVVLFRMANRKSVRNFPRPKRISKVRAESEAKPLAVVSDDAVMNCERAWTALDDHQLDRLLKDSSP